MQRFHSPPLEARPNSGKYLETPQVQNQAPGTGHQLPGRNTSLLVPAEQLPGPVGFRTEILQHYNSDVINNNMKYHLQCADNTCQILSLSTVVRVSISRYLPNSFRAEKQVGLTLTLPQKDIVHIYISDISIRGPSLYLPTFTYAGIFSHK